MSTNGAGQNGPHNLPNGTSRAPNTPAPPIFTVEEALPYTPLSSIFQFNPDIIPLPSIGLRSSTPIFANNQEREEYRAGLDSLNREAQGQDKYNTSERLAQSLNRLKELLQPEGIARFKFKTAPTSHEVVEPPRVGLTNVARIIYESTAVEFESASPKPLNRTSIASTGIHKTRSPSNSRSQAPVSKFHISNLRAYKQNASINAQHSKENLGPQILSPQKQSYSPSALNSTPQVVLSLPTSFRREDSTPSQQPAEMHFKTSKAKVDPIAQVKVKSKSPISPAPNGQPQKIPAPKVAPSPQYTEPNGLAVVIPGPSADSRPNGYEILPDSPDTPQHLSRKRKHDDLDPYEDNLARGSDEREKADRALRTLRDYLQDVFEAEDQMQMDSIPSDHYFTATNDGISLNVPTQTKIEAAIQKVIACARFSQVPIDDLLRLQRLCEGAVKDVETLNLSTNETMGSSEVAELLQNLSTAELGIKAARTSLRLMTGSREEKQLYSEDIIQSALNAFKNVADHALVPIVEMRSSGTTASVFKLLVSEKAVISNILKLCQRLLSLMAKLVGLVDLSDTVINTLEFTVSQLIFVENASSEKDSVLGIAKFDNLRTAAMEVLSEIFLRKPAQRRGIVTEILASLEKLPGTKQSARHFRLPEGGTIQHVSALIMQLIQTSAMKMEDIRERRNHALEHLNGGNGSQPEALAAKKMDFEKLVIVTEEKAEQQSVTAIQELQTVVKPLTDEATRTTMIVVNYIVERAMTSTKTGDTPYRNLLDLFVQDFITCLPSTDWPAAELLLRMLLFKMVKLSDEPKTPAPVKNMALEILGLIAAAISDLFSSARKLASSAELGQSDLGGYLCKLAEDRLENRTSGLDTVSWVCGPFRTCVEALDDRASSDSHLNSAIGLINVEWARRIAIEYDQNSEDDYDHKQIEKGLATLAFRSRMMITDRRWLSTEYDFEPVPPAAARLAYTLVLLDSEFARWLGHVLRRLLVAIKSDQATVRSKGLRSINQLLDKDPTLIEREAVILPQIQECLLDGSVQVRESALNLIAKIISSRPKLENANVLMILGRVSDSGVGVRKRAMKLAKEIYLRNHDQEIRSAIAEALMSRVDEADEGVRELASQTMEDIWMSPFYEQTASNDTSPQFQLAMEGHVKLMVKTVQGLQRNGNRGTHVLDKVLQNMLSDKAKFAKANLKVCKALVASMFETIIDNSSGDNSSSAISALQILETFSKSNPQMFTAEQMKLLQPYTKNFATTDQLHIFRSVVNIYRHVLPHLSPAHGPFLDSVRADIVKALNKANITLLDDLVACISVIAKVRQEYGQLNQILKSVMTRIMSFKNVELDAKNTTILKALLPIVGCCAKHVDFEPQRAELSATFEKLKKDPVPKFITDTLAPFASPSYQLTVRTAALQSIGMVCQSWPKNFSNVNIYTSFEQVFEEKESALEMVVIKAFKDFLFQEEKRSEAEGEDLPGASTEDKAKLGVMGGSNGFATEIAQRFLSRIIDVALTSKHAEKTLLATEVIASIARQGLMHPKQPGIALIALETSPISAISEMAFREHRKLHEKHETLFERDYMTAAHGAYDYQRDVVGDTHGAKSNPFVSKLHLMAEVLKISKVKTRKKFYDNLCSLLESGKPRKDGNDRHLAARSLPDHLAFSQFIIENMAFFDYPTIDELLSAISAMEKRVFLVGTDIANSIETDIFKISLDQPSSQVDENGRMQPMPNPIDVNRLRDLTASSMILSMLGETRTYLKRQYGLKTNNQNGKSKSSAKDTNRAPVRIQFINGEKLWAQVEVIMHALDSEDSMMQQCRSFVELLNHDPDFKIAAEGEDDDGTRAATPDDDDGASRGTPAPPGSGRGRKRKASLTPSTPGKKKRGRAKVSGKRQSVERSDDDDDF